MNRYRTAKLTMQRDLETFVQFSNARRQQGPALFARIENIYAPVWRCSIQDRDLKIFLNTLYQATIFFKPRVVVQTGTFVGISSLAIGLGLEQNQRGCLYTIDPDPPSYFGVSNPVSIARGVVRQAQLENRVRFLTGYSTVPLDGTRQELVQRPNWLLEETAGLPGCDMLVVDGDHTFLGCYLDLVCGARRLAEDGARIIIAHDYRGIPEVRRAVDEWRAQHPSARIKVIESPCGISLLQV